MTEVSIIGRKDGIVAMDLCTLGEPALLLTWRNVDACVCILHLIIHLFI